TPPETLDLVAFGEKLYLLWGPLPGLLLMAPVALLGVEVSDILVTVLCGALNVWLVALVLEAADARGVVPLTRVRRGLLVLFFALGTVHLPLAPLGRVWQLVQLIGFACVAAGYLAALRLRGGPAFLLVGLAFAGALLTRTHMAATLVWPAVFLLYTHRGVGRSRLVGLVALLGAMLALGVGLLAAYNWARFGNPLETGAAYHLMTESMRPDFERYGYFNLHFVPTNLLFQYVVYPFPLGPRTYMGGSLLLLSPLFFAALARRWEMPRWSYLALIASVALTLPPILLLMNTGFAQFGPRYTLDFTVPLLLLTAAGARRWPLWLFAAAVAVSIAHYALGTLFVAGLLT
ncbi:MAG: hypothetical protein RLZZ387_1217, partial [Chloroflexota bacterium]